MIAELGADYSLENARLIDEREAIFFENFVKEGATVTDMPAEQKMEWVNRMADLGMIWVETQEANGVPGRDILAKFMATVQRGRRPNRCATGPRTSDRSPQELGTNVIPICTGSGRAALAADRPSRCTGVGGLGARPRPPSWPPWCLICADVVSRYFFSAPINGVSDFVAFAIVACVFLQLGSTRSAATA